MLDQYTRTAILQLSKAGHGVRTIAKALSLSRNAVRDVVRSGAHEVPAFERDSRLSDSLDLIRVLHEQCQGNLVRVMEKLSDSGIAVGYSTLTAFCRRHEIGHKPKQAAGQYHFAPGEEMQHDTSPHAVVVGGKKRALQCASLVQCYSTALYAQVYPRFSRLECRAFLSEGCQYFGGAAERCMVDNTSVIIAHGTGKDAQPAACMRALAERFGFYFEAHAVGDADRSAHVERRFHYIEHNFYPGREFADLLDLNTQLLAWCDAANAKPRRRLPRPPVELLAAERNALRPLPLHVPEVYESHRRRVGVEGYVSLHTNRYPVPDMLIGRHVDVHETVDQVRILDGHKLIAQYAKYEHGKAQRAPVPKGLHRRGLRKYARPPSHEEQVLRAIDPAVERLIDALKKRDGGRALKAVRRLHRMYLDYPTDVLLQALRDVADYGLIDLFRIEKVVLRRLAGDFFRLPIDDDKDKSL
jgi:transposase